MVEHFHKHTWGKIGMCMLNIDDQGGWDQRYFMQFSTSQMQKKEQNVYLFLPCSQTLFV